MARLRGFADRRGRTGVLELTIVNEHASVFEIDSFRSSLLSMNKPVSRRCILLERDSFRISGVS